MRVLLIEGGGMKAAYANGVLTAFEEQGFRPWDAVVGTSAGGALAAWYSAGQAAYAQGTWKYAADPRVLSVRRLVRGGPFLDHEALLDIVYVHEHPLDMDAVKAAPWPVIVTAADVRTGDVVYRDIRDGDVLAWLKATGRLPLASGPAVRIDGRDFVDGGTIDPIPIRYVCETLRATHVTLIVNKVPRPKRSDARLLAALAARRFPALSQGIRRHDAIKHASFAYAQDPPSGTRVDIIHPQPALAVKRFTRDLDAIQDAITRGHADGIRYVQQQTIQASA